MRVKPGRVTAALMLLACCAAHAADRGGGHFRKGDLRLEAGHVVAVVDQRDPQRPRTFVYLSNMPLDAAKIAAAFNPGPVVDAQLADASGYVRICIDADGSECGLYFSHNQPSASFNSAGYGSFTLQPSAGDRKTGRWVLAEPQDFFGESYDFDLQFDVAVTPPPGQPLPAGGGAAGKAYQAWTTAVAKGDLETLKAMAAGDYDSWRLRSDDQGEVREALKDLRDGSPVDARILGGRMHGDTAVLHVEGRDRDEILRRGRVEMLRVGGEWRYSQADLDSVDE